ncbi:MAG: hypothetical protein ABI878_01325 [Acidobacteriota bacterium]
MNVVFDASGSNQFDLIFAGDAAEIRKEASCNSNVMNGRRSLVLKTQCISCDTNEWPIGFSVVPNGTRLPYLTIPSDKSLGY